MSLPWKNRKQRLQELLNSRGNEREDGLVLDRLLHGHHVIGKTARTSELDQTKFQDADFRLVGALDYGQFGAIDVVHCHLNGRVYVRKSVDKKFALRSREQCNPQIERDILMQARLTDSKWAPHLLCAFQTPTHLKLVMDYAEGGTLWDVLESSPFEGRISEADVRWWAPQIISAVHWCHSQGYVHRDIKPHNFVLKPSCHLLLIDFGTAAPLLPPLADGSQRLLKNYCLVPCGTCDYISPEILRAHEQALVALEMNGENRLGREVDDDEVYGRETDWWSVGAMLYEITYGVAPFFAEDVRKTYAKIVDPNRYVRFKANFTVSMSLQHFIGGLLKDAEFRLGRRHIREITSHEFFRGVDWAGLASRQPPAQLHMPHFEYADPNGNLQDEETQSKAFAFSELFQSSLGSSPAFSILRDVATPKPSRDETSAAFIGFSWGPTLDAFPGNAVAAPAVVPVPRAASLSPTTVQSTPAPLILGTPMMNTQRFSTPLRSTTRTPFQTLSINRNSTIRRTVGRRAVSDREALKQLVDLVGMSARKRVLESGRKPRFIPQMRSRSGSFKFQKELRFDPTPPIGKVAVNGANEDDDEDEDDTDMDGPPSPSPSPRPGSSMSRRSATPTTTATFSRILGVDISQRTMTDASRDLSSRRAVFMGGSSEVTVDDLEAKHMSLMRSIYSLERRLEMLASIVNN